MRIVLLHFLDIENKKYSDILKKLADTASKNGHQIDVVNGMTETDSFRITPYDYAAVVCAGTGFFSGKIPSQVAEVLAVCGTASGKKGCALIVKGGLAPQKTCRNLMHVMEKEGMLLDYFDIIESPDHAAYVGKKIG